MMFVSVLVPAVPEKERDHTMSNWLPCGAGRMAGLRPVSWSSPTAGGPTLVCSSPVGCTATSLVARLVTRCTGFGNEVIRLPWRLASSAWIWLWVVQRVSSGASCGTACATMRRPRLASGLPWASVTVAELSMVTTPGEAIATGACSWGAMKVMIGPPASTRKFAGVAGAPASNETTVTSVRTEEPRGSV